VRLRAVAPRAADLLVVAFESRRQPGVNHGANIGLVDSHAEGNGGHHHLQFARLEGRLHALARLRIETRMVGGGWQCLRPPLVTCLDAARLSASRSACLREVA
jgi:hypothetical protein